jgi:hypothetical protein
MLRDVAAQRPKDWLKFFNSLLNDMHHAFSTALDGLQVARLLAYADVCWRMLRMLTLEGLEVVHDIDFAERDGC